jgi:plasmid stabilization system protein ParE
MSRFKYDVRLLRIAEDDFSEIVTYISADRPSGGEALARKIEKNLILLSKNPHLGRVPKEGELARLHYRYLVVEDYLVFYTNEGRTIYVHRILHGARDYPGLF